MSKSMEDYRREFFSEAEQVTVATDREPVDYSKVYGTVEYWLAKDGKMKLQTPGLTRAQVLDDAKEAVCNDRNEEYGEPIDNFGRWAGACNSLGYRGPGGRELKPHDLAVIMGLGKLSRSVQSPDKQDTWTDLAGYAAVGYELVTLED